MMGCQTYTNADLVTACRAPIGGWMRDIRVLLIRTYSTGQQHALSDSLPLGAYRYDQGGRPPGDHRLTGHELNACCETISQAGGVSSYIMPKCAGRRSDNHQIMTGKLVPKWGFGYRLQSMPRQGERIGSSVFLGGTTMS